MAFDRRKFLRTTGAGICSSLLFPCFLEARTKKQRINFWKDPRDGIKAQEKLKTLYQRPYNALLYIDYIKYLSDFDEHFPIDKKSVNSVLFFNIHIFSLQTREITKDVLRILFWEKRHKENVHLEKKVLTQNNQKEKTKNKNELKENKETNETNIAKNTLLTEENLKKAKITAEEQFKQKIQEINLSDAILYYAGYSYLSIDNLFLYKEMEIIPKILKHINNRNSSFKEVYLKSIWTLLQNNSQKENDFALIEKEITFIESKIFKTPFQKQQTKFKDKKFRRLWKHFFRKRTYENFTEEHYNFAYLLSLLSFYYSLLGYKNYSLLFLNKIKEKFLINSDLKTIMFYFYINLLGFFLTHNYGKAVSYFETILSFDKFLYYQELGFLIYSNAAISEYNNKNYRSAWQYANQAVKYGITLDPVKYLDQVILMKKVLKNASNKYISLLREGNNLDLINYVKKETLYTLGLTF